MHSLRTNTIGIEKFSTKENFTKDKCKNKFASKVRKSVMLGYVPGKKAYHLYDPITRTVFTSHHVTFDENHDINVAEFIGRNLEDK